MFQNSVNTFFLILHKRYLCVSNYKNKNVKQLLKMNK